MNAISIVINYESINKIVSSSYLFESCDVLHNMLDHVNYNYIQMLIVLELLSSMIFEKNYKFEICVQSKLMRHSF